MTQRTLNNFNFFKKLCTLSYVEKIILYGSRARGDFKERSDIDMAILCSKATREDWMNIVEIIENADTLLKIDYVRLDTLDKKSTLFEAIQNQGVEVYVKDRRDE